VSSRFATHEHEGVELLQCEPLAERGLVHGFTTRARGFGSRERAAEDRERLEAALSLSRLGLMRQVHGNAVCALDGEPHPPEADAIVTDAPGAGVAVQSADCVPILIWAERRNAVSAVHAGWGGTLAGVAGEAVRAMIESWGAAAEDLHVALGPAIRICCFEVGDEVVSAFAERGRDVDALTRPGPRGRRHLDILEDNRRQLVEAGVATSRLHDSGLCTVCENDRFYSYRKEGPGVGRILGVVAPRC
jgi:YfiH family protein